MFISFFLKEFPSFNLIIFFTMDDDNEFALVDEDLGEEADFLNLSSSAEKEELKSIVEKVEKLEDDLKTLEKGKIQNLTLQLGVEIGEKFGKEIAGLRGKNEELKEEMDKLYRENGKLKEELARKNDEIEEKKRNERALENAGLDEIRKEMAKLRKENDLIRAEIQKKNRALEDKIVDVKLKYVKLSSYPEKAGFKTVNNELATLLSGRIKKLAETVELLEQQMEALITNSAAMKQNKWNGDIFALNKCALYTSDSFALFCAGFDKNDSKGNLKFNSVYAEMPICLTNFGLLRKQCIAAYFEVKMLEKSKLCGSIRVGIGFCPNDFPLQNIGIGGLDGSIGLYTRIGMSVDGELMCFKIKNAKLNFAKNDVIGCGLIYSPNSRLKCFATLNGAFLGSIVLPPKYSTMVLYPAASLYFKGEMIRANFGAEDFLFDSKQLLGNE